MHNNIFVYLFGLFFVKEELYWGENRVTVSEPAEGLSHAATLSQSKRKILELAV